MEQSKNILGAVSNTPSLYMKNAPGSRGHWLSAKEAACYLGVAPRTLLKWARQGKVRGYQLSVTLRVRWRFLVEDLDSAILEAPSVALPRRIM